MHRDFTPEGQALGRHERERAELAAGRMRCDRQNAQEVNIGVPSAARRPGSWRAQTRCRRRTRHAGRFTGNSPRTPEELTANANANPGAQLSAQRQRLAVPLVVVSNHGGRQLESTRSSLEWLPSVVETIAGRMTVLIDGGIRTGTDVAKAIALGADAVQLGRAPLYGSAAGG